MSAPVVCSCLLTVVAAYCLAVIVLDRCENASANSDDRDDHDVFATKMNANRRSFNLIKSY